MTGRYQQRSGIEGVVTAAGHRHTGLSPEEFTLADYLRSIGYSTAIFGKWHLGYDTAFSPLNNGFDHFRGYVSGNVDYHSHIDQSGHYDWWLDKDTIIEDGYVTDLISRASVEFIRGREASSRKARSGDAPFFLYVAHEAPHYPYQGRNDPADRTIGGEFLNSGSREDRKNAYREMVEAMDDGVGEILSALDQSGQLDNTFLFFCSDNGANNVGSNQPLKGFKGKLWEGGHRVPAIAYWHNRLEPGINDETILSMDIFPTIMAITGHGMDDSYGFDGISFLPSLISGEALIERPVFWRFKGQQAIRKGPWKLLVEGEEKYLYNLNSDPGELTNLMEEEPVMAETLMKLLDQWILEMDRYPPRTR
jgi:arylsulfatase A-like enzyme